ncbi:MAG: alpha-L-fucosidase [Planctomycetes bacterium]|nr:alpha-L-fucosidase [Planctomycetota bacterium]
MTEQPRSHDNFHPTITSLLDYQCPKWFRDAKLGIYLHWGAYSVPEIGEWYPRLMYQEGHPHYLHHCKTYGHPSKFGYKDLIPLWRAEHWDPDRLVDLFKKAGAKYFTPCAVHHDNFDLWNSRHHRWNSVNMGPRKDIVGLWRQATLAAGLRFGVTTHLERTWSWFATNKGADISGPFKGVPYDGNDPAFRDFYLEPHEDIDLRHPRNAPPQWREHWSKRIKDLIDNYHPDHLYFDGGVPFAGGDNGQTGLDVLSHLYNDSLLTHDGSQEAVMCVKDLPDHGLYAEGICTLDLERERLEQPRLLPWQTDTSIGPWGYTVGESYRPVGEIIHELVDIVSKNGNLLLNVPPKADCTLDEATEAILADLGRWMAVNGDAIYGTRPWITSGSGTRRFTRKGNDVYAILLEWPQRPTLSIPELGSHHGVGRIAEVSLLGHKGELRWAQDGSDTGELRVVLPDQRPGEHAWALRVHFHS